jgi:hypothetical protein
MDEQAEVIHAYSRAQAIEDGFLVAAEFEDESDFARQAGWSVPVALTAAVYAIVEPTEEEVAYGQDLKGRLWDLLSMGALHARAAAQRRSDIAHFPTIFYLKGRGDGDRAAGVACADLSERHRTLRFKAVIGPGDDGAAVVTIMLPEED